MKQFTIRLELRTKSISLKKLACLTGFQLSDASRNIGDLGGDGRPFAMTIGVIEAEPNEVESENNDFHLVTQCLLDKLVAGNFDHTLDSLQNISLVANIGVFFDTANCSLEISPAHSLFFGQRNIKTSISFYPSSVER
jgi:hypothetical protein